MDPTVELAADARFNRRFLAVFALFMVAASFAYIAAITFLAVPKENQRFADTVLGFLLGTLLGTLITFFYGSSKSNQSKDAVIAGQLPTPPAGPVKIDDSTPVQVTEVKP